jgi:hypothetical protein
LWSRFPLAERPAAGRPAAARPAAREARDGAREVAFVPSPPTVESATGLQPYLVAAFGVSVFATALLLAVVAVSASRTATYHRFLATRGTRPLATPPPPPERGPPARRHLALVPTDDGYTLVELEGDPPRVGTRLSGSDLSVRGRFTVSKVGPSPLPADDRRCAYLERV